MCERVSVDSETRSQSLRSSEKPFSSFLYGHDRMNEETKRAIRKVLRGWLAEMAEGNPAATTRCRSCGREANHVGMRAGVLSSDFGLVRYQRAYYVCPHCHRGTSPLDERLDPVRSLARLHKLVLAGRPLPVAEMAHAWSLGSASPG
jgi:hypothetical protein